MKRVLGGILLALLLALALAAASAIPASAQPSWAVYMYLCGSDLETNHPGLYVIGDGSGVTHSLSHASASGVYVADLLAEKI